MPITNPIQSWLDEFEEETGIEITVEYVNGELILRTNEHFDVYIYGVPVWDSVGKIIREVADPSYSATNLPSRPTSGAGWIILLVGSVATAAEMYQWLQENWDYYPDYDRAYGHKKYGGDYWRVDD